MTRVGSLRSAARPAHALRGTTLLIEMRYFEPERRSPRRPELIIVGLTIVILVLAALVAILWIRDDDSAGSSATTTLDTTTTTVLATPPELTSTTPQQGTLTDPATLVEDCVQYVPTAIYFGNFYMKAIWDTGGGTPEGLRRVCESMLTSDPGGLQRMSDEFKALKSFVETSTTV